MNEDKKFVLSHLFTLPKEEIFDIYNIINGYKERVNKSAKDTLLARCVFINGYHKTSEFYKDNGFTKDSMCAKALNYETKNIDAYLKLKEILEIDDYTFIKILDEII